MMVVALMLTLLWTACGTAEELDLSHRGLEAAPADLCSRGVRAANLCANELRAAPPCCSSFRRLYLYRNSIEELPPDWLADCPLLEEVSVSGNSLRRLPARLLSSNWSLRRLQASRNMLHSLPPQLLSNATALTELDLGHNLLMELPQGVLDTTSHLGELFLQANALSHLPEDLLSSCGRLQVLWLSRNRLTRLPKALLASSPNLRTLRLDHNLIVDIAAGAFDNNHKIQFLDLSSNRLASLPAGMFRKMTSLRRLLLADNLLTAVPPAGSLPQQPAVIDLSQNLLQTIDDFGTFGESRVALDHNAWCHDLIPASQLSHFSSPERRRWFQQRAVRYDRLAGPLTAAGLLHCGSSAATRKRPVMSDTNMRSNLNAADSAAAVHKNRGTLTQSQSTSETITSLTNNEDLGTHDPQYSTPVSATTGWNILL